MSDVVIRVENLSKHYRLGTIGGATLREDMQRWWAKARGRPDPLAPLDHPGKADSSDHWALRNVSFEVKRGEVLGVIGRNGAGKSTLLKILSRTTSPTTGRAKVKGRIGSLLEVGTGFHPELTGRENIYLNGSILGMRKSEIDRKMDEIIDFSGVARFINTPVKRYSSGMYVRLAFAVAAHLDPEILIVDEVLAVGDSEFQKRCLGKMKDVASQGRTILFVSHNLVAVESLCTRGLLLADGRSICDDSIPTTLKRYSEQYDILLKTPLEGRSDRQGSGGLRFLRSYFVCDGSDEVSEIRCGDCVTFFVEFEALSDFFPVSLAFNLYDTDGYVLLNLNTDDIAVNLRVRAGVSLAKCVIPSFPLRAGVYFGNIYAAEGGNILDWVQRAFSIKVVDSDFHKTGRLVAQGKFVTPYEWDVV